MIKLLLIFMLFAGTYLNASATDIYPVEQQAVDNEQIYPVGELERRGCCSHHKGVCGCSNGRVRCCDGTLSPSCTC